MMFDEERTDLWIEESPEESEWDEIRKLIAEMRNEEDEDGGDG